MNVFIALKLIRLNHRALTPSDIIITDASGKPDSLLTDLLADILSSLSIFADLQSATCPTALVDQLRDCTPLREDVLAEYTKLLEQEIAGINVVPQKQLVELVYKPLI